MTAPYEDREGWDMTLTPLAGSIYMELHDPPEAKAKRYVHPMHSSILKITIKDWQLTN